MILESPPDPGKVYLPGKHYPGSEPGNKVDFPTRPNVVLDLDLDQRWTRRDYEDGKAKAIVSE